MKSATLQPPDGMRWRRFTFGSEELLVISWQLDDFVSNDSLTPAEHDVALGLARGWSMRRIANARKTSLRTVANQARSIYAKLGVRSRLELAVRLRRRT